jgi:hypothetical protein
MTNEIILEVGNTKNQSTGLKQLKIQEDKLPATSSLIFSSMLLAILSVIYSVCSIIWLGNSLSCLVFSSDSSIWTLPYNAGLSTLSALSH